MKLQTVNLGPVLSSRRLFDLRLELVPVDYALPDILDGRRLAIPQLPDAAAGYRFHSVPVRQVEAIIRRLPYMHAGLIRRYERRYVDMRMGFDAYMQQFSSKTRSTLKRKSKNFAKLSGGQIDLRCYRTPQQLAEFFDIAGPLSEHTYQERHLDAGLPRDEAFRQQTFKQAEQDAIRAFILFAGGQPVSYLFLPIDTHGARRTLRYEYLGYEPGFARTSPGTVLQLEALRMLMNERSYTWFDFTAGDGAHKMLFSNGSASVANFVMLDDELINRMLLAGLDTVDRAFSGVGFVAEKMKLKSAMKRLLRR